MNIKSKAILFLTTAIFSSTTFAATSYFCPSSVTITCNQQSCKNNLGRPEADSIGAQVEAVAPLSSNDFQFEGFQGFLSGQSNSLSLKQGQTIKAFFNAVTSGSGFIPGTFDCSYLSPKNVTVDGKRVYVVVSAKAPEKGHYIPDYSNKNWSHTTFFAACDHFKTDAANNPHDCPLLIKDGDE